MRRKPSHRQAPQRKWPFLAVVIFELLTLVALCISVPSLISDMETLTRLLAFLVEIARLV